MLKRLILPFNIFLFILGSQGADAHPLNQSLEQWDWQMADDPYAVFQKIQQSWDSLDARSEPGVYLRALSMDCLARAQFGEPFRDEAVIEEGLQSARQWEAWDEAILLTSCMARMRVKAGQHEEGRRLYEEAVEMAARYGKSSLHIRTLVFLSDVHLYNNELGKALSLLKKAQAILESDQNLTRIDHERLKVEIAMGLEAAGSHEVGMEIYESALQFFVKSGLRRYQVVMNYNLAEQYNARDKLDKARHHFRAAAEISRALKDELTHAFALVGVANVERRLKNYDLAESLMEEAISFIQNNDLVWWAESLITLSDIKKDQSRPDEALALLEKAESVLPNGQASTLEKIKVSKEAILLELGQYKLAYELRKELSDQLIEKLKSDAKKEYSKLKVDLGLAVEEERAALLLQENDREKKISYYKTIASFFMVALILVLGVSMIWLKNQRDKIRSMQQHIQENVLQRFLPPEIVEGILSGRSPLDEAAQETTVTILFCDLVDFTSSSERLGADRIARVLNQFFKAMTEEIFETGGTIDKFIGDAIMVLFGAPIHAEPSAQAQKAFECAQRILSRMERLNERWRQEEGTEFAIRIGLHQGQAIVGSFGSQQRSDYTAIGLHVNIAARIETAARPDSIFFSEAIARHLREDQYRSMGLYRLRGLSEELELFTNESLESVPQPSKVG